MGSDHVHRVCTYDEAEKAIRNHEVIYLNECFCRGPAKAGEAAWSYCGHSTDTCMGFHRPDPSGQHYEYREISRREALDLVEEWKKQGNLFRFMEDQEWICFCCSCGCEWFRDKEGNRRKDPCGTSPFIERTDLETCNLCGDCVPVCAYEARRIETEEMLVDPEACYG